MKAIKPDKPKLHRVVHWSTPGGKFVVVEGPFPYGMFRSETRHTVEGAAKISQYFLMNRPETTKSGQYAKVLASDIVAIEGGENEFGEVSP